MTKNLIKNEILLKVIEKLQTELNEVKSDITNIK